MSETITRCLRCRCNPCMCHAGVTVGSVTFSPEAREDIRQVANNTVIDKLTEQLNQALSLLKKVEWVEKLGVVGRVCEICGSKERFGHDKNCELGKLIGGS